MRMITPDNDTRFFISMGNSEKGVWQTRFISLNDLSGDKLSKNA
ncbi:hypothetical protein [Klebsiella sp. RIT-PI-d]|nr:hypothetical protein [Klebsiella sp. RIT-PI-d]